MTSQKSFFSFKIMKESIKQTKYIMLLHTIALFLMTTLPAYVYLKQIEQEREMLNYMSQNLLAPLAENPLLLLTAVLVPLICAVYLYSYLFKPNSVQFFNSMPYTRCCTYLSRFAACAVSSLLPVIFVYGVNSIFYVSCGLEKYFPYAHILSSAGEVLLTYLGVLSLCVFAVSLAGNFLSVTVIMGFTVLWYPATCAAIMLSFDMWSQNLSVIFHINPLRVLPEAPFFWSLLGKSVSAGDYVYSIVWTVIFFALGLFASVKRRSENTNKFFPFRRMGTFLKYYVSLVGSLAFGAAFLAFSNGSLVAGYIGYILILFILYAVMQAIFEKDMHKMFANMKHFTVFAALWAVVLVPFNLGLFDKIEPSREWCGSVEIDGITWRSEENIDAAFELYEAERGVRYEEGHTDDKTLTTHADNPFVSVERRMRLLSREACERYEAKVYGSEEYKNKLIARLDGKDFTEANIRCRNYRMSWLKNVKPERGTGDFISDDIFDELCGALMSDIALYSYGECSDSGVYAMLYVYGDEEHEITDVPIYRCYEGAVKVLNEKLHLAADTREVVKAEVYSSAYYTSRDEYVTENLIFATEDQDEIAMLLDCLGGNNYDGLTVYVRLSHEVEGENVTTCWTDDIEVSYNTLSKPVREKLNMES